MCVCHMPKWHLNSQEDKKTQYSLFQPTNRNNKSSSCFNITISYRCTNIDSVFIVSSVFFSSEATQLTHGTHTHFFNLSQYSAYTSFTIISYAYIRHTKRRQKDIWFSDLLLCYVLRTLHFTCSPMKVR